MTEKTRHGYGFVSSAQHHRIAQDVCQGVVLVDSHTPAVMIVRARRGVVRESERLCHIVPVPEHGAGAAPVTLTAYCGARILPGETELMGAPAGMPCTACLGRVPVPGVPEPGPRVVRG